MHILQLVTINRIITMIIAMITLMITITMLMIKIKNITVIKNLSQKRVQYTGTSIQSMKLSTLTITITHMTMIIIIMMSTMIMIIITITITVIITERGKKERVVRLQKCSKINQVTQMPRRLTTSINNLDSSQIHQELSKKRLIPINSLCRKSCPIPRLNRL